MTNPTCPHDHLECAPDMEGYLNCRECPRYKMPEVIKPLSFFDETETIAATGICYADPGSPEGDTSKVVIAIPGQGRMALASAIIKRLAEMDVDVVIVGQPEVPGRTITATTTMPIMPPPDIPYFELEQKKRHQPKGHERPYKFHK